MGEHVDSRIALHTAQFGQYLSELSEGRGSVFG